MSGSIITTLLIIGTIVWYVVSAIVEAKERQARKQAEATRRAARPSADGGSAAMRDRSGSAIGGGSSQVRSARDELAERRQRQLEELRRRRGGPSTSGSQAQVKANPSATPSLRSGQTIPVRGQAVAHSASFDMGIATSPSPRRTKQPQPAQPSRRQPPPSTTRPQARPGQARQPQQPPAPQPATPSSRIGTRTTPLTSRSASRTPQTSAMAQRRAAAAPVSAFDQPIDQLLASGPATTRHGLGAEVSEARSMLRSPSSLRQAIILKEILDPPVSMRGL